jgi:hypothetical protein
MQVGLLLSRETELAQAFRVVADRHGEEPDIAHLARMLAAQCEEHAARLAPFPEGRHVPELLRDLQELYLKAAECELYWSVVLQLAQAMRDEELTAAATECEKESALQCQWLKSRIKQAAPQALLVTPSGGRWSRSPTDRGSHRTAGPPDLA